MKTVAEHKFQKMIREEGCTFEPTGSGEWKILYKGLVVTFYGVSHEKGQKR